MVETLPLSEFVEINPKVKLKKGVEYQFVEMVRVVPKNRCVSANKPPRSKNKYTMTTSRLTNHEDYDRLP